ncbi:MAG: hypothetical protein JXB34_12905 [Bacteroidales bacterium]|nr:hypothetical protein [Bacteroidales bacterium]
MKRYILIILAFTIVCPAFGQSMKRAFKSLEKLEYDKAKESFEKILNDNSQNVAANFGIALIKSDDKSAFFDIVDSWKYIELIKGRENELTQEEIDIIGEYFLNTEVRKTNRPVKKKIEIAQDAIEARLIKYIREENDLEAVYRVLELYPGYKHTDNVTHIRNQFEFRKYEKLNTLAGYEEFIARFPDAAQAPKAARYRNKMAFEEVKLKNTVEAYNNYIEKYPESRFVQQAAKLRNAAAFEKAKQVNTLEAFEGFIKLYPDALEIPDARKYQHQLMYEKAKRIKSLEAYNEFIRMYPDGAYYIDVFNLKATDLGMKNYRLLGFDSPDFVWAKALDYNEQIEVARSIAITSDGGYIVAGVTKDTLTNYTDAWIVKLDARGNMVWNKTIGQQFNDEVMKVLVAPGDEVVVVGYTQPGADTNLLNGWMFKLGNDGRKIWNKNLGEVSVASCAIDSSGKIYMATYVSDTIPDNYYLQVFNTEGTKVGERTYSQPGIFNEIAFSSDGSCLLAGSKWITFSDPKFYIRWEDTLKTGGTIVKASINNSYCAILASDTAMHNLIIYSLSGKNMVNCPIGHIDSVDIITDMLITAKNEVILLGNTSLNSYACKYNEKGQLLNEKLIPAGFRFVDAIKNNKGDITYLLSGNDYQVITYSSAGM